MQAVAWWLIPITATLLAVVWVTWINRPRKPADAHDSLAEHRRFTDALERTESGGSCSSPKQRADADKASDATPPAADR